MKISITDKDLSIMVNYAWILSGRREIQRRHAPSMQDMNSLMELIRKEIQNYPISDARITAMSI